MCVCVCVYLEYYYFLNCYICYPSTNPIPI